MAVPFLVFVCKSLHLLPPAAGDGFPIDDWATDLCVFDVIIGNCFIDIFLSIQGRWAIQSLFPGHPGRV